MRLCDKKMGDTWTISEEACAQTVTHTYSHKDTHTPMRARKSASHEHNARTRTHTHTRSPSSTVFQHFCGKKSVLILTSSRKDFHPKKFSFPKKHFFSESCIFCILLLFLNVVFFWLVRSTRRQNQKSKKLSKKTKKLFNRINPDQKKSLSWIIFSHQRGEYETKQSVDQIELINA